MGTGSDGRFLVRIRLNTGLTSEEEKIAYKKSLGHILETSGELIVGSPEWVGFEDERALEKDRVDSLSIESGTYIVDVHSLLTRDQNNVPEYIQFVFCLYNESRYHSVGREPNSKALKLQYNG